MQAFVFLDLGQQVFDVVEVNVLIVDQTGGRWQAVGGLLVPALEQDVINRHFGIGLGVDHARLVGEVDELVTVQGFLHNRQAVDRGALNHCEAVHVGTSRFDQFVVNRRRRVDGRGRQTDTDEVTERTVGRDTPSVQRNHGRLSTVGCSHQGTYARHQGVQILTCFQTADLVANADTRNGLTGRNALAFGVQEEAAVSSTLEVRNVIGHVVSPQNQCSNGCVFGYYTLSNHHVAATVNGVDQHRLVSSVLGAVVERLRAVGRDKTVTHDNLRNQRTALCKQKHMRHVSGTCFRLVNRSATRLILDTVQDGARGSVFDCDHNSSRDQTLIINRD